MLQSYCNTHPTLHVNCYYLLFILFLYYYEPYYDVTRTSPLWRHHYDYDVTCHQTSLVTGRHQNVTTITSLVTITSRSLWCTLWRHQGRVKVGLRLGQVKVGSGHQGRVEVGSGRESPSFGPKLGFGPNVFWPRFWPLTAIKPLTLTAVKPLTLDHGQTFDPWLRSNLWSLTTIKHLWPKIDFWWKHLLTKTLTLDCGQAFDPWPQSNLWPLTAFKLWPLTAVKQLWPKLCFGQKHLWPKLVQNFEPWPRSNLWSLTVVKPLTFDRGQTSLTKLCPRSRTPAHGYAI